VIRPFFESCQVAEYRQEEVAFLFMKRTFFLPSREWTRGFHKMLKETPSPFLMLLWWNEISVASLTSLPLRLEFLAKMMESLSRVRNFHGIKTGVQRLQSLPSPAVAEKGLDPPEKPVSITSTKTGKPSIPEHRRFRKEFRTTRNLVFGQRRGFAGISAKWHS
jgi:hypothetical protein